MCEVAAQSRREGSGLLAEAQHDHHPRASSSAVPSPGRSFIRASQM